MEKSKLAIIEFPSFARKGLDHHVCHSVQFGFQRVLLKARQVNLGHN